MRRIILFLVYTSLSLEILESLKEHLEENFCAKVDFCEVNMDINYAYDFNRNQYLASSIINRIIPCKEQKRDKWLFLMDVDLYSEGFNFIFGEAHPKHGIALVSLTRLRPEFYGEKPNKKLFVERLLKEVTHELGHLFYLPHCENPKCVMSFSNSIWDTDRKSREFCLFCKVLLRTHSLIV